MTFWPHIVNIINQTNCVPVIQCNVFCVTVGKLKYCFYRLFSIELIQILKTNQSASKTHKHSRDCVSPTRSDEERSQIFILCKHCNFVHVNINHHVVGHLYKNKRILVDTVCLCQTLSTSMRQNWRLMCCHLYFVSQVKNENPWLFPFVFFFGTMYFSNQIEFG